eukprot:TRINITY_DN950_c1_g1_i1.p1 TRINITY_DN950_c1_g1~~TRINITY_DN950_c1_g1_i1.p1  ORF type:complete len:748 (+),score=71.58 TRINITY_DN950_c1_g1_i1:78-2246(+)
MTCSLAVWVIGLAVFVDTVCSLKVFTKSNSSVPIAECNPKKFYNDLDAYNGKQYEEQTAMRAHEKLYNRSSNFILLHNGDRVYTDDQFLNDRNAGHLFDSYYTKNESWVCETRYDNTCEVTYEFRDNIHNSIGMIRFWQTPHDGSGPIVEDGHLIYQHHQHTYEDGHLVSTEGVSFEHMPMYPVGKIRVWYWDGWRWIDVPNPTATGFSDMKPHQPVDIKFNPVHTNKIKFRVYAHKFSINQRYVGLSEIRMYEGCETCATAEAFQKQGYRLMEYNLLRGNFDVRVSCAPGYAGTAQIDMCSRHNEPYKIRGCTKLMCVQPRMPGYIVHEKETSLLGFRVHALCAESYFGSAQARRCTVEDERYNLEGCQPIVCKSPPNKAAYRLNEVFLTRYGFDVSGDCHPKAIGSPEITPCGQHNQPYSLRGCRSMRCTQPRSIKGYVVHEKDLNRLSFDVQVSCEFGYHGNATSVECDGDYLPYELKGCEPGFCTEPDTAGYLLNTMTLRRHDFNVMARCAPGYIGRAQVVACTQPNTPYNLSGCHMKCDEAGEDMKLLTGNLANNSDVSVPMGSTLLNLNSNHDGVEASSFVSDQYDSAQAFDTSIDKDHGWVCKEGDADCQITYHFPKIHLVGRVEVWALARKYPAGKIDIEYYEQGLDKWIPVHKPSTPGFTNVDLDAKLAITFDPSATRAIRIKVKPHPFATEEGKKKTGLSEIKIFGCPTHFA